MPITQVKTRGTCSKNQASRAHWPLLLLASMATSDAWSDTAVTEDHTETRATRNKRAHVTTAAHLWPDNTVYYVLTNATPDARRAFLNAAGKIAAHSALRFVERTDQPNYVYLSSSDLYASCHSEGAGMLGGPQSLNLSSFCRDPHTTLHETLHVAGFEHEHQRPDRDQYIRVHPDLENEHSFKKATGTRAIGPYDFRSVTHYSPEYLIPRESYTVLDPNVRVPPDEQRTQLSPGDIAALQQIYPRGSAPNGGNTLSDNGLSARLSKRYLTLAPGAESSIDLSLPPGLVLQRTSAWSEKPQHATAHLRERGNHRFSLDVKAINTGKSLLFFEFATQQGQVGTVVMEVTVNHQNKPCTTRQLVSRYNRQCLSARPVPELFQNRPADAFPEDHDLVWVPINPAQLQLALTDCNGDDPWQIWALRDNGQLTGHTGACLAPRGNGLLHMEKCSKNAPLNTQKWRQDQARLQHLSSGQGLSYSSASTPILAPWEPQTINWQEWEWH